MTSLDGLAFAKALNNKPSLLLFKFENIENLDYDATIAIFKSLSNDPNITNLAKSSIPLTDELVHALGKSLTNMKSPKIVNIKNDEITIIGAKIILDSLENHLAIIKLALEPNNVNAEDEMFQKSAVIRNNNLSQEVKYRYIPIENSFEGIKIEEKALDFYTIKSTGN